MPIDDYTGLKGKKALVLGGGLGMGRATARILADAGMGVGVVDVLPERAEAVAAELRGKGAQAVALNADVMEKDQAAQVVQDAVTQLGDLDVLVDIVGRTSWSPLLELEDEMFDLDINRNLRHVLRCGKGFAAHLKQRGHGGAMVNIASVSGLHAATEHGTYGAAKAALISLTKTMAVEWADLGIRVNCIAPGSIRTDRSVGTPESDVVMDRIIPLGRRGHQDEIAKVVLFLASDLSSYVTGQMVIVDGGLMASNPMRGASSPSGGSSGR